MTVMEKLEAKQAFLRWGSDPDEQEAVLLGKKYASSVECRLLEGQDPKEVFRADCRDSDDLIEAVMYNEDALEFLADCWEHGVVFWNYLWVNDRGIFGIWSSEDEPIDVPE